MVGGCHKELCTEGFLHSSPEARRKFNVAIRDNGIRDTLVVVEEMTYEGGSLFFGYILLVTGDKERPLSSLVRNGEK